MRVRHAGRGHARGHAGDVQVADPAHAIIAVPKEGLPEGQNDGVVAYQSAHVTGATPGTIMEVRRILYEHLGIPCGLECQVVERVDAAEASMAKPEAPAEPAGSRRP